jgi:hypothetical protein
MVSNSSSPGPASSEQSATLSRAVAKLLRPLVRLLLHYQLTYPQLINLLKATYVDVAEKEFAVNGKRQSDSRINLLTGVHRKDVKRLRAEDPEQVVVAGTASLGAQIISRWLGEAKFTDEDGEPRALKLRSDDRDEATFEALVQSVCRQDIRPRVILDEWVRLGVATLDDDLVRLNSGAFTPDQGFDEKVFFFGKNLQDHLAASGHNLRGAKPALFDRSVYYDGLSAESVEQLSALANELGMQALIELNRQALALQQRDAADENKDAEFRINFGIFNYNTLADRKHDA